MGLVPAPIQSSGKTLHLLRERDEPTAKHLVISPHYRNGARYQALHQTDSNGIDPIRIDAAEPMAKPSDLVNVLSSPPVPDARSDSLDLQRHAMH